MSPSIRLLCLVGGLALLSACRGSPDVDNLAILDARLTNGADGDAQAANDAIALAAASGYIEKAPAATVIKPGSHALDDLRRGQVDGKGTGEGCASNLKTGPEWAERMPKAFRPYPGAKLNEASGVDTEQCALRMVSFTTATSVDPVLDYYYTMAHHAGYDAEHLLSGSEHQLGGTRASDGAAYVVFAHGNDAGQTQVDIVANAD